MARIIHAVIDGNVATDAEADALEHAKKLMAMIDKDGDGTLSEEEFTKVRLTSTLFKLM